jgi:iron complex outermembrane receptor protein
LGARTKLTLGGRYTIDKRKFDLQTLIYGNLGAPIDAPVPAPTTVITNPTRKKTFKTPTWRVILDHEIADRNMIYASYSRGFKAGNFPDNTAVGIYRPEKIDAYEVGYKGQPNSFIRTNLAGFYYKYKNQQVTFFTGGAQIASNAASSTIYGGELEVDLMPTSNFSIHSGFSYLHAKFDRYTGATCVRPTGVGGIRSFPCDVSGKSMTRSPKFTATIQPKLIIPSEIGEFNLSATYYHSSRYFSDVENIITQKSLDLLSARLAWTSEKSPITLAVFGSNLTNQKYWAFANPASGGYYYSAAMPRTYGLEVKVDF